MGKQNVPIKARKAGGGGAPQKHTPSAGGRKHGGIGATNAFDNLMYRSKHEVLQLGKPKGKLKRPAASLSASLAARQQSLLAEFGAREKANSFVDERLEEHNSALDHEDKLLLRFQKERQKRLQAGGGKFALDDAEDTMQLTHQGQALSLSGPKRQRAEGEEGEDDNGDEDEDAQDRRLASSRAHGDEDDAAGEDDADDNDGSGPTKSRHEVMSEVMLKSKMYRAERAVLAGEQQDLMGNLDTEFDLVRGQMQWASREDREAAKKAHRAAEVQAEATGAAAGAAKKKGEKVAPEGGADGLRADGDVVFMDAQLDPTDEFVLEAKQLGLDVRAKASDRLKSDEEIIAQEKRRLEKLERQRLKRMRGEVEGGADEQDDDEPKSKRRRERKEAKEASRAAAVRKALPRTDDDLESNVKLTSSAVGGRAADQVDEHELLSDDEAGSGSDESGSDEDDSDDSEEDSEEEEEDEAIPEPAGDDDDAPIKAVFIGSTPSAAPAAAAAKSSGPKEIFIGKDGKSSVSSALLAITAKLAGKAAPASASAGGAAAAAAGGDDMPSNKSAVAAATLPFTFPAPSSYKEFKTLLAQYPPEQHSTIIARIRTCNHISLLPSNAQKMEKFYGILLTHFRRLAAEYARLPAAEKDEAGVAAVVARMDEVAMHVLELTELQSMNGCVGRAFRGQLSKIREGMDGPAGAAATFQPDELLLLKLVASLFPTSDFRHNVTTPTLLLLAEWLNRLPVAGGADLVRGFFAVSLVLHAVNASKRLVPEVLTFLHAALLHGLAIARSDEDKAPVAAAPAAPATATAAGKKGKKGVATNGSAPSTSETGAPATGSVGEVFSATPSALRLHSSLQPRNCNFIPSAQLAIWAPMLKVGAAAAAAPAPAAGKKGKKDAAAPQQDLHIPLHWLFHDNAAPVFSPTGPSASALCASTYSTALQLVHQAAQLWQATSPCYGELFMPIMDTLGHVLEQQKRGSFSTLPPTLQSYTQHLHSYLSSSIAHSISLRVPLEASLAPLALKSHAPLFTEGYNPTKDYDPIKERAQIKELSQKLKREKKGALRELRRDTAVVVQQQRAVQQAHAAEREAKRKEVWSQMEEQQRDTNIMQKASKKAQDKKDSKKSKKK